MNPIKLRNLKKRLDLGVTGLETTFGPPGPRTRYAAISPEPWLQFPQTQPHFLKNYERNPIKLCNLKKCLDLGFWDLETTFRPPGPRRRIQP